MANNNKDIIERKLRAIAANVTNCKMDQVSLKLQINTEKNKLGGGMYGTAYKSPNRVMETPKNSPKLKKMKK